MMILKNEEQAGSNLQFVDYFWPNCVLQGNSSKIYYLSLYLKNFWHNLCLFTNDWNFIMGVDSCKHLQTVGKLIFYKHFFPVHNLNQLYSCENIHLTLL